MEQKPNYEQFLVQNYFTCETCNANIEFEGPKRKYVSKWTTTCLYILNALLFAILFLVIRAFIISPLLYIVHVTLGKLVVGEELPDSTIIVHYQEDISDHQCRAVVKATLGSYRQQWQDLSSAPAKQLGNQVLLLRMRGFFMQRIRFWENLDKKYVLNDVFSSGMLAFVTIAAILSRDLVVLIVGTIYFNGTAASSPLAAIFREFGSLENVNYNFNHHFFNGWPGYFVFYAAVLMLVRTDTMLMICGHRKDYLYEAVAYVYKHLRYWILGESLELPSALVFKNKSE
jgi:hypothetical protein